MTQLVEQLEDVNREVGITDLRWNVNLLGTGVGWVTPGLLDRLQALGCSVQLSSNNWVNSTENAVVIIDAKTEAIEKIMNVGLFPWGTHIMDSKDNYCH